jgi:hypothetical protein
MIHPPPDPPDGYQRVVIESVRHEADGGITVTYAGRIFGGIMKELLPPGVAGAIRPGVELFFRYGDGGADGERRQVVHVIMRRPGGDGWAELYADWE